MHILPVPSPAPRAERVAMERPIMTLLGRSCTKAFTQFNSRAPSAASSQSPASSTSDLIQSSTLPFAAASKGTGGILRDGPLETAIRPAKKPGLACSMKSSSLRPSALRNGAGLCTEIASTPNWEPLQYAQPSSPSSASIFGNYDLAPHQAPSDSFNVSEGRFAHSPAITSPTPSSCVPPPTRPTPVPNPISISGEPPRPPEATSRTTCSGRDRAVWGSLEPLKAINAAKVGILGIATTPNQGPRLSLVLLGG
ncbi:hypothetical protein D9611_010771 [Ephemerocybe angulata]|uniref:Uncharacterized protein n=1 Tax=Ephemerocybe angulata TaxID=980116 RepID=A0A8H5F1J6_9AGAR|nr:hypothetical protein D9611_010771 [Tulosesus angulatus]